MHQHKTLIRALVIVIIASLLIGGSGFLTPIEAKSLDQPQDAGENSVARANLATFGSQLGITDPVINSNIAPVADSGPDQLVDTSTLVNLDGSGSRDPDGNIPLTYLWTQTGGTTVTLSSNTIANPNFTTPAVPTTLTFTLVVTDNLGLADSTPDPVNIVVNPPVSFKEYLPLILKPESPPAAFNKVSPINGVLNQSSTPTLSWETTSTITDFEYCYDTTNDNACSTWISNDKATAVQLPTLPTNTTYYWQVRAWNNLKGPTYANGSQTSFWSFTIPINPIANGDFEAGQNGNWTEFSTGAFDLIINSNFPLGVSPHGGSWAVWLGGDNNETSQLSQVVPIPSLLPYLHYWYLAFSPETSCENDYFRIKINGTAMETLSLCGENDTDGWVLRTMDLSAYIGMPVTLMFEVTTNGSEVSQVFLDDVTLAASARMVEETDGYLVLPAGQLLDKPGANGLREK
jgi:hypothetical protein